MSTKLLTVCFTVAGIPTTLLTPTITAYSVGDVVSEIASEAPMTEIGSGWYSYAIDTHDPYVDYIYTVDGGDGLDALDRYKSGKCDRAIDPAAAVLGADLLSFGASGSVGEAMQTIKSNAAAGVLNDATLMSLLTTILKHHRNRTRIDLTAAQLVIYDDDGATPLTTFNLRDFSGMPNVQEVCEKIPVI